MREAALKVITSSGPKEKRALIAIIEMVKKIFKTTKKLKALSSKKLKKERRGVDCHCHQQESLEF
jgi:hypothetical protein